MFPVNTFAILTFLLACGQMRAQAAPSRMVVAGPEIDRALLTSSLPYFGKPFHAVMEIDEPKHPGGIYEAQIDLSWVDPKKYHLILMSKDFRQDLVVNGDQAQETNTGEFYPAWLRQFAAVFIDPAPHADDPVLRATKVRLPSGSMPSFSFRPQVCAERTKRVNGINDEMTTGEICFDLEHRLTNVQWYDYGMGFSDYASFGSKQIARKYTIMVSTIPSPEYIDFIDGHLTTLEPLRRDDAALFEVRHPTPASERIQTKLVSTAKEESLLESAPQMDWPSSTHGVLEGYLIVHAVTDKSGRVRSARRTSADNSGMEGYAIARALEYKFKPLLIDGVAVQMETPLVMHFVSSFDDSIPRFHGDQENAVTTGCAVPKLPSGLMATGSSVQAIAFVNEAGALAGIDYAKDVPPDMQRAANDGIYKCHFAAIAKAYHVDFSYVAP